LLTARIENERVDGTRPVAINGKHLVPELAENCQCLIVKRWQRSGDNEPPEIEVRHRQLALAKPLRLENLTVSVHGALRISETEKAVGTVGIMTSSPRNSSRKQRADLLWIADDLREPPHCV
jgi:hypothetical protein